MKNYKFLVALILVVTLTFCLTPFKSGEIIKVKAESEQEDYIALDFLGLCNYYYQFPTVIDGWDFMESNYTGNVETKTITDSSYTTLNFTLTNYYSNSLGIENVQLLSNTKLYIQNVESYAGIYGNFIVVEVNVYDNTLETNTLVHIFLDLNYNNIVDFSEFVINGEKLPTSSSSSNFDRYNFGDGGLKFYAIDDLENLTSVKKIVQPVFSRSTKDYYALYNNVIVVNYKSTLDQKWKFAQLSAQVAILDNVSIVEQKVPVQFTTEQLSAGYKPYQIEYMPNTDEGSYIVGGIASGGVIYLSDSGTLYNFDIISGVATGTITNERRTMQPTENAVLAFGEDTAPYDQYNLIYYETNVNVDKAVSEWYTKFYAKLVDTTPPPPSPPKTPFEELEERLQKIFNDEYIQNLTIVRWAGYLGGITAVPFVAGIIYVVDIFRAGFFDALGKSIQNGVIETFNFFGNLFVSLITAIGTLIKDFFLYIANQPYTKKIIIIIVVTLTTLASIYFIGNYIKKRRDER